ncbi:hypothetical protein BX666DRAFT_2019860 [Dichotomocladium elegans]|nr:hypothetical protein BX666DRAFT_2019860 [Dichotomocladium elegans]
MDTDRDIDVLDKDNDNGDSDHEEDWEHSHHNADDEDDNDEGDDDEDMHEDMDVEEEDDEDIDDDDDDELERIRRSFGLHLQSSFGGMMSDMASRLRSILASLKKDEPTMQLVALQELTEILSVSNEENLAGDSFIKELVKIMKGPSNTFGADIDDDMMVALAMSEGFGGANPELALLACRCISNLLDAMPTAVNSVVYHGAIGILCQKLKSIEYIDLAEQALYALEKVASHMPRPVVQEGGLSAALMYFDFFSIHSQRTALRTAANCMRGVDAESFPQVMEVVPTMFNTISYPDRTVVELTCLWWVKFAEAYRNNSEFLERAINVDLLEKMMALIPVPGNTNVVRPSTFTDLLRIFRVISRGSPKLGLELIKLNIVDSLYQVLTGSTNVPKSITSTDISLDNKWRDSVYSILRIFVDVLPSLPRDRMFSSKRFRDQRVSSTDGAETPTSPKDKSLSKSMQPDPRVELLANNQALLRHIDQLCVPVLLEVYTSTVNLRMRQLVTHSLVKLMHFSDASTLQSVLKDLPMSSFLAGILAQQEHSTLMIDALFQVELLLKKVPEVYRFLFEREGVLHEVETIASTSPLDDPQTGTKQAEEESPEPSKDAEESTSALDLLRTMQETMRDSAGDNDETSDDEGQQGSDEVDKVAGSSDASAENSLSEKKSPRSPQEKDQRKPPSTLLRRRIFDHNELNALLRSRFNASQAVNLENEKGIGRGSTRVYVIRLAQAIMKEYQNQDDGRSQSTNALKEIQGYAKNLMGTSADPCARETLRKLIKYLQGFKMGISSFELMNSGLLEALLGYLTDENGIYKAALSGRQESFISLFLNRQLNEGTEDICPIRVLVMRLQEILSRSEPFEVVMPLESSSLGDNVRNPTNMLAKQLRLRLTGRGSDIPAEYQQLIVSTHAVATFKVLEDYLLTRIATATARSQRKTSGSESRANEDSQDEEEGSETEEIDMEEKEAIDEDEEMEDVFEKQSESIAESSGSSSKNQTPETKRGKWVIRFYLKDTLISNDTTVYGAVHRYELEKDRTPSSIRNIWIISYPVTYERVFIAEEEGESDRKIAQQLSKTQDKYERPPVLADDSVCTRVLKLLSVIFNLSRPLIDAGDCMVPSQDFVNRKVVAKMNRQLEEPLIVASSCLPGWTYWLMKEAPFLFPFETRYLFIQSTSFGYSRLIARWQNMQMRNNNQRDEHEQHQQPVLGRMERQKVRIMRSQMLESAIKVLDLFGSSQSVLEIEYTNEEGTGLGPTLEFYATTSREFCKRSLNMWRDDDKDSEGDYVVAKRGLFPRPLIKRGSTKVIDLFRTLGQFLAKAMLDFRIVDLPFSVPFFKVALGHEKPSTALIKTMEQKIEAAKAIEVDGNRVENLYLDFTLPGDDQIELKKMGADIPVTINNIEEYIDLVLDKIVGSGVAKQVDAFRQGFDELFALDDLKILTYSELVSLFGVSSEDWSYATLADAIKADHGFTMESPSFKNLLLILSEFNEEERREFLQFTTGSPRLPIGGWKAMRPVFTVVCKTAEGSLSPDDYLPSVMTCANYLKMPDYSSKEKMRTRLLTSMREGKNSFLLS